MLYIYGIIYCVKIEGDYMILNWIKNNVITTIIIILAAITCFFVPIDKQYLSYFDYKTLICLACILVSVQCLKNSGFFQRVSKKMVYIFKDTKSVVLALILLTFIIDLVLANDMSLITLLPLTYIVLSSTNNMKYFAFTLILQNIAANMSGMITPHGNPQNIYLFSFYDIPTLDFIKILLPHFFIVLLLLIVLPLIFVKKEPLTLYLDDNQKSDSKIIIYFGMFLISLSVIFKVIPYIVGLFIVFGFAMIFNRKALREMDWDLLFTFAAFFIFSGNISRIPAISEFLIDSLNKSVVLTGMLSCQFISNVPSAILLSKFTLDYESLIVAVNIGSLGTLISSLASLITLKHYLKAEKNILKYILLYTAINVLFLSVLLIYIFLF